MKILVVHVSAGAGHRRAAEAFYAYARSQAADSSEVLLVDALSYVNPFFRRLYRSGYSFLVNHACWLWAFAFWVTSERRFRRLCGFLNAAADRITMGRLSRFFVEENPDAVVSTHFMPSEVVAYLKRKGRITSKLFTVITDFSVHPFWVYPGTDLYLVASSFAAFQLFRSGIPQQLILESGIPVDRKFLIQRDRSALSQKFGIDPGEFTVLLMTGSFGLGPLEKIAQELSGSAQVLVVCAANTVLYGRLRRKGHARLKVFGFVDNVEELMGVCDVIVTKPGGMTIAEVIAMGVPPVFVSPIPGQETSNIEVLARYSVGAFPRDINRLKELILEYRAHPERLARIKQAMKALQKPDAAGEIYRAVCQGCLRSPDRRAV